MSIRNLDFLFDPVLAPSSAPATGLQVWVPPCGATCGALPATPDLAVICTPARSVSGLIAELGERGTRETVVPSAGLTDRQHQAMHQATGRHLLRTEVPRFRGGTSLSNSAGA